MELCSFPFTPQPEQSDGTKEPRRTANFLLQEAINLPFFQRNEK